MNIVIVTPEATPFSKTGGLADVSGALAKELKKLGHDVKIFTPFYKVIQDSHPAVVPTKSKVDIRLGKKTYRARIWQSGDYYFIREDHFFYRDHFYGVGDKDYVDNPLRFAFFARASLEAIKIVNSRVDIIHCHDWQTGLIPCYLKNNYQADPILGKAASIFTIHNLAYQGLFPRKTMDEIDLPARLFTPSQLEFYNKLSFIKGGLVFADLLTTVSRKYSREIQETAMGCGLDGLLRERKADLHGINNGIDYDDWNPETDRFLPANYGPTDLRGKKKCKKALKKAFNLTGPDTIPLIGMVSRLDSQKGFEIIAAAEKALMKLPLQLVFVGSGAKGIENYLVSLAERYPEKVSLHLGYSEPMAHLVEAGADIYLMPSRYEPCGLNHLYSLRYGTLPVVRATGGLDDTIINYSRRRKKGNGFKFRSFCATSLVNAVRRAIHLFMTEKEVWKKLQKAAMEEDHCWEKSVHLYDKLYQKAMADHERSRQGKAEIGR